MRGIKRVAASVAVIGLSAGLVAGCGSSSTDTASTTGTALTAAQYKTKVLAICTKLAVAENDLGNTDVESVAQAEAAFTKAADEADAAINEIKAITPPADLQAAHDDLVSSSQESVALFDSLVADLKDGSAPSAATLEANAKKAMALAAKQEAAATKLGLAKCFMSNAPAKKGFVRIPMA